MKFAAGGGRTRRATLILAWLPVSCWQADVASTVIVGPIDLDNPVVWYPLDDPAAPGRDHSANHLDALAVNFVVLLDAERGYVAHFDGGALLMKPPLQRDFTLSMWLKTKQMGPEAGNWTEGPRLVDADIPGAKHIDFGVSLGLDKLVLGIGDPTDATIDATSLRSSRSVADGRWHHAAMVRDGTSGACRIFIDGRLDLEVKRAPGALDLPPTINLGDLGRTSPQSPPLQAELSDVRFYDRALPTAAIASLATP